MARQLVSESVSAAVTRPGRSPVPCTAANQPAEEPKSVRTFSCGSGAAPPGSRRWLSFGAGAARLAGAAESFLFSSRERSSPIPLSVEAALPAAIEGASSILSAEVSGAGCFCAIACSFWGGPR